MHEVSIARAVVETVLAGCEGAAVESVEVHVGAMSGVTPSSLEFGWQVATTGSVLDGARLVVHTVPTTVHCDRCDAVVTPEVGLACPACGTVSSDVRSGRELDVHSVRLVGPEADR